MKKRTVSIIYFPGTNCEVETAEAFRRAGANPKLLFIEDLLKGKKRITDCDLACFAGGFSYGDYAGTGIIAATLISELALDLKDNEIPTLGICNGYQIMIRAGMFGEGVTLTTNDSGTFCSRPILHRVVASNCIWTKGLEGMELCFPAAHGGGKVVYSKQPNVVLEYVGISPNGGRIAGICSEDGLFFGLMDHPERPPDSEVGQMIFENGVWAV